MQLQEIQDTAKQYYGATCKFILVTVNKYVILDKDKCFSLHGYEEAGMKLIVGNLRTRGQEGCLERPLLNRGAVNVRGNSVKDHSSSFSTFHCQPWPAWCSSTSERLQFPLTIQRRQCRVWSPHFHNPAGSSFSVRILAKESYYQQDPFWLPQTSNLHCPRQRRKDNLKPIIPPFNTVWQTSQSLWLRNCHNY